MPLLWGRSGRPMEGPLGICPECNRPQMVLAAFNERVLNRVCHACGHEARGQPPKLQKRVLYLDQWVISQLANTLDPVLRQKKVGRIDPYWGELYRQLERLVKLHVIVCPESPLHQQESIVTPYFTVLRELYEHLAGGVEFDDPLAIHTMQLARTFNRVVRAQQSSATDQTDRERALRGSFNQWLGDIRITVSGSYGPHDVASENSMRASADSLFARDMERWRQLRGRPFKDWYDEHRRDMTGVVAECFARGTFGLYHASCCSMIAGLEEAGVRYEEAVRRVMTYLASDEAMKVPFCDILSLLYAGMAKKVADEGQASRIDHGHYNDMRAIAAYLPYCDAITLDAYFEDLLRKPRIAQGISAYATKVFAPRHREGLLSYLRELEDSAPQELRDTVLGVYGSSWLKPYDTILEYQREQELRRRDG